MLPEIAPSDSYIRSASNNQLFVAGIFFSFSFFFFYLFIYFFETAIRTTNFCGVTISSKLSVRLEE